ncbi:MAG: NAD(P)H-hydrate dehydratase [Pyrinomonadaceae bacterium MAG19_C2-C3]|nr:NAD(P)H-hydrate dehydratase [Pyrinomonadaceae bacterium MAG19_C2-C3]
MQKIISAEVMRELDRLTVESCATPSLFLMEAAASGALDVIVARLKADVADRSFLIFCGAGNNGGDGAGLARALVRRGARRVDVVLLGSIERTRGDARINFEIVQKLAMLDARITFREFTDEDEARLTKDLFINHDVIVDALFGTGLSRPASGIHHRVINLINEQSRPREERRHDSPAAHNAHIATRPALIVALDLPSGLFADDAVPSGACVRADLTVTFTAPKLANVLPPAARFNGELVIVSVGTPDALLASADSQTFVTEARDVRAWLKRTRYVPGSYKNSHGHALIVAGSRDMNGAPVLCADAAHIAGAGLVTVATPHSAHSAVSSRVHAEVMVAALEDSSDGTINTLALPRVAELSERATVIAVGSGLSSSNEETTEFVRRVVHQAKIPVLLDADALNAVAPFDGEVRPINNAPLILTPHEGEMRRLMNTHEKDALANRVQAARDFAVQHKVILVLKGERVIIAAPDGKVFINPFGNPATGTAGTGDTLAGIITGFLAQEFAREEHLEKSTDAEFRIEAAVQATVAAVYVASLAADFAARETGMRAMRASDIRTQLSRAFCTLDPDGETL